jgi:hypothetical protein
VGNEEGKVKENRLFKKGAEKRNTKFGLNFEFC